MASNSKSGVNKNDRETFLKNHGFVKAAQGKGSHESWVNFEIKLLSRSSSINPPENLKSNSAQKPWETTLPDNPAGGTWKAIKKFAIWASDTVDKFKSESANEQIRLKTAKEFNEASRDIRAWRKAMKHRYKTGIEMDNAPETPISYKDFKSLENKKKELSQPSL